MQNRHIHKVRSFVCNLTDAMLPYHNAWNVMNVYGMATPDASPHFHAAPSTVNSDGLQVYKKVLENLVDIWDNMEKQVPSVSHFAGEAKVDL